MQVDQPPASSVRKFLALLEQSDIDFSEEIGKFSRKKPFTVQHYAVVIMLPKYNIELRLVILCNFYFHLSECQRLKAKVVQQIRSNQQLEQDLDVMDIKIGLLVKNRLTLQDLVSHSQQVRRKDRKANRHSQLLEGGAVAAAVGGLTKANHEKVEVCKCVYVYGEARDLGKRVREGGRERRREGGSVFIVGWVRGGRDDTLYRACIILLSLADLSTSLLPPSNPPHLLCQADL